MKKIEYIFSLFFLSTLFSCSANEFNLYSDVARLQFGTDTLKRFSFFYSKDDVIQDTIFFNIYTIGKPCNYDRAFRLVQLQMENSENAIPNLHYKAFDSYEMKEKYMIPKNAVQTLVPIVLLRDASLKEKTVFLKFRIESNNEFLVGDSLFIWRKIEFTAQLSRPSKWDEVGGALGEYSFVKHAWMIKVTGFKWDNDYLSYIAPLFAEYDYICSTLRLELLRENREREERGEEKMKDENGVEITFPNK